MRRKSTRNAQKATPEKAPETPPKTRRSRRRKRSPSKSSDSDNEVLTVTKRAPVEETPDTTTKSHSPTDEETNEEPMWQVTTTEDDAPQGEIHKLKICLTRPSPDSPNKRRSKSNSQTEDETTSSEDKASRRTRSQRHDGLSSQDGDEDMEEKKGKGKSKGKNRSKIEKSPHVSETERQTNNEISENVQVTPQSPSIDKPVDNENDHKVDVADKIVNESVQESESVEETRQDSDIDNNQVHDNKHVESDDDEPLSVIQKSVNDQSTNEQEVTLQQDTVASNSVEVQQDKTQIVEPEKLEAQQDTSVVQQDTLEIQQEILEIQQETPEIQQETVESQQETVESRQETVEVQQESLEVQNETVEIQQETLEIQQETSDIQNQPFEEETSQSAVEKRESHTPEIQPKQTSPKEETETVLESKPSREEEKQVEEASLPPRPEVPQTPEPVSEETNVCEQNSTLLAEKNQEEVKERVPRLRLKRNQEHLKTESNDKPSEEPCLIKPSRIKRKWVSNSDLESTIVKVSLETIQSICPTIDFPEEPDLNLEVEKERRKSSDSTSKKLERKVSVEYKSDFSERPAFEKQISTNSSANEDEERSNIIAFNRKISIVDDTASKLRPPPSPAKNPASNILFITNLVRPFTVKQLKELLERTGKVVEEGFWTDRIKSKCYVQYESQEEAEITRNALHGVQWPIGNGKKLIIDFATEEDLQNAKNPPAPPIPTAPVPEVTAVAKENVEPSEAKTRLEVEKPKEPEERKKREGPVREWDIGKKDIRRDRSRSKERGRKHRRSPSLPDDFISRKQRKAEESVPQKLMDDLFLKTKATPSIYWQPLSPEEISMKQQQRLIRMEEHKRRMEENNRMKGREIGRGAFRRRYD